MKSWFSNSNIQGATNFIAGRLKQLFDVLVSIDANTDMVESYLQRIEGDTMDIYGMSLDLDNIVQYLPSLVSKATDRNTYLVSIIEKLDNLAGSSVSTDITPITSALSRIECLIHDGHVWEYISAETTETVPFCDIEVLSVPKGDIRPKILSESRPMPGDYIVDDTGLICKLFNVANLQGVIIFVFSPVKPTVTIGNTYTFYRETTVSTSSYSCSVCGFSIDGEEGVLPSGFGIPDMALSLKSIDEKMDTFSISASPTDLTTIETTLSNIFEKLEDIDGNIENLEVTVTPDSPIYDVIYIDDGNDTTDDKSIVDFTGDILKVGGKLLGTLYRVVFVDAMGDMETSLGDFEDYYSSFGADGGTNVWD